MANINLRSLQSILGSMIARVKALTDINDLSPGSNILTTLEAAATSDFMTEAKLIQILNSRNIDKTIGVDLENLGFELGVTPSRFGATGSAVQVTIYETSFSKIASNIYAGANAPTAGDTTIKLVNGSAFNPSGTIFLGRGTSTSESIDYVSTTNSGSYWTFNLASPLTKDHLVGEEVVLAQGGNRVISTGNIVSAAGGSGSPDITFTTLSNATLLDGESSLSGIQVRAQTPGSASNVGVNKISNFIGAPWSSAAVSNPNSATGGRDAESDSELRERIKDHVHTLSAGTEKAIKRSVIGTYDGDENKSVVSAYMRKPIKNTDPTILFIDDGTGYAPPFSGIGQEIIVTSAIGTEQFLQLQKWPLVKSQVASVGTEPFALNGGESLYVVVDATAEERTLSGSHYKTLGVVSAQEVAEAINKTFTSIEARAKDGQLFITPTSDDPDFIRVGHATLTSDVNSVIRFPVGKQYTIRLYKNDVLLEKNGSSAIIQSLPNSQWTGFTSSETLQLTVDGINSAVVTYTNADFSTYTSSNTIASATVADWVIMINRTFIGVTASARDDGTFTITSNRGNTSKAQVSIFGGTVATKIFPANSISQGISPEYKINRLLGTIELSNRLAAGDELKAGNSDTRGFAVTSAQAAFTLNADNGYAAEMVIIADATYTGIAIEQANTLIFTSPSSGVTRATGVTAQFSNIKSDDWCHLYNMPRHALLRVISISSDGSQVNFADPSPGTGTAVLNGTTNKMNFFRTSGLPQVLTLPIGLTVNASDVILAVNSQLVEVNAAIIDTGAIRLSTQRFIGGGSFGIASLGGDAGNLGISVGNYISNDPHTAVIESGILGGIPSKRIVPTTLDNTAPYINLTDSSAPFSAKEFANKAIDTYLGSASRVIRQPLERLDPSDLTLRSDLPKQSVGLGPDARMNTLSGLEFGQADNMVFLIDNDPGSKTFDVPMFVDAVVASPSVPSTTQMDLADSTGALLGSSTRWLGHRFEDYRVWFQAKKDLPATNANSQIRITSVAYGPNGENIRAGVFYPTQPLSPAAVSFGVDPLTRVVNVNIGLGSGSQRLINLSPNLPVSIEYNSGIVKFVFLPPVDLTAIVPGDILSLLDSNFAAGNQGQMKISSISNLSDFGHAFQFPTESITCDVIGTNSLVFSTPPSIPVRMGDRVSIGMITLTITAVSDPTHVTVGGAGFTSGSSQSAVITHQDIQISATPSFTAAVDDRIVCGGNVLTITAIQSPTRYTVDLPFSFSGLQTGTMSRINVIGSSYNSNVTETKTVASVNSIQIMELPAAVNKASVLITLVNNTAGVKDLVLASNAPGSTGAGFVSKSTEDELNNGQNTVALQNGESYVYSTSNSSPTIRLKEPATLAPEIGEKVRLIPSTAENVKDHFSRKQITGLTVAANVALVDQDRRVQVSSKIPGGLGQVFAIGGRASGLNTLNLRGTAQEINSSTAQIELDKSSIDLLVPGHTIKISQTGTAKKRWVASSPVSSTNVAIAVPTPGTGTLTLGVPFVNLYSYTQSGSVKWAVRNIGRNRVRFEIFSGTASIPGSLLVNDWVLIGNGISYAGITTDTAFAPANQGWFQIRETDNSSYFDVDGVGVEQYVSTTTNSFVFTAYHSARPGDKITISYDAPVASANKGTFVISSVGALNQVSYLNPNAATQVSVVLGSSGTNSIGVLDQGYSTYRKVVLVSPKPSDPTNRALVVVEPGFDMSLLSEGQNAKLTLPARLAYGTDPVPGISGYSYWVGLKQRAQRVVDGFEAESSTFEGVGAAGVSVEVREPQIQRVQISLKIKTAKGVSLQALSDTIKTSISGYINSLALGKDVVMSEAISIVQQIPGIDSVLLVLPVAGTERITVGDSSIARINVSDITLSG